MYEYDEECLKTFLENQSQLFDEPVAETLEGAEAFLSFQTKDFCAGRLLRLLRFPPDLSCRCCKAACRLVLHRKTMLRGSPAVSSADVPFPSNIPCT